MTENWDVLYWTDTPIMVFDTETTGFSSDDRICEIALSIVRGLEVIRTFSTLINPECPINEGASALHGITDEHVASAPTFTDVKDELLSYFFMDAPWVAHNMAYDLRMLSYVWPAEEWPKHTPTLCTLNYAKCWHPATKMRKFHKLPDLARYFYVDYDPENMHGATYDVQVLHGITYKLMGGRAIGQSMTKFSHEWR